MELCIESAAEARALFSAILAAKFSPGPKEDLALVASPLLANVAWRLRGLVEKLDYDLMGDQKEKLWSEWDRLTPDRREWKYAAETAAIAFGAQWHKWEQEQRIEICRNLLSPFRPAADMLELFVRDMGRHIH